MYSTFLVQQFGFRKNTKAERSVVHYLQCDTSIVAVQAASVAALTPTLSYLSNNPE